MSQPGQDPFSAPFSQFNFLVDFGDGRQGGFTDMSGLEDGLSAIDYRTSRNPVFSASKMPGIAAPRLVTLKRGVIAGGAGFPGWHRAVELGRIEPGTIRVTLRDEQRLPVMTWTLADARPTKIVGPGREFRGTDVAIETLELVCESIAAAEG